MSLCTEVDGLGGKGRSRSCAPSPRADWPRLWCTAEHRDESVKTMSLPSWPSRAPGWAWIFAQGDAGAISSGAPRGRCVGGGCRTGSPMENSVAWRRGPGRPGPCAWRAARAALCAALCAMLYAALCAAVCAVLCASLCAALCAVLCIALFAALALCAVLCAASCCALRAASAVLCAALCAVLCAALCAVLCAASCGALCASSCGALCAAPCGALCAASCGVLCAVLCAGSACALSWCCVLCAAHCAGGAPWCCAPFAVPCAPAPGPALPACPACPVGRGGGVRDRNGGGIACPPLSAGQPKCCRKHRAAPVRLPLVGKGGGSSVTAGRGRLALRARRDAVTTSRSGEGACRASRRGSNLRARCEGLSGAGSAADAGLARPSHAERALAPAWRAAGASTCRLGARRC